MGWAIGSVVGFALVMGAVIALARTNTARWERNHRAAQAAIRARNEASLKARAAALVAQPEPDAGHRLPHPHLPHLPHVHLPPRVVGRLAQGREVLRLPRPRLPHLDGRAVRRFRYAARHRRQSATDPGAERAGAESDGTPTGFRS